VVKQTSILQTITTGCFATLALLHASMYSFLERSDFEPRILLLFLSQFPGLGYIQWASVAILGIVAYAVYEKIGVILFLYLILEALDGVFTIILVIIGLRSNLSPSHGFSSMEAVGLGVRSFVLCFIPWTLALLLARKIKLDEPGR
jgi:hypothetical protein